MEESRAAPWATLTPLFGEDRSSLELSDDFFIVGTDPVCDLIVDKSGVSACHCTVIRSVDGSVVLQDTSENGTLIDGEMVKNQAKGLTSGAELYLVHNSDSPEENVVYLFEILAPRQSDRTQSLDDEVVDAEEVRATKRRAPVDVGPSEAKAARVDSQPGPSCKAAEAKEEDRGMLDTLICAICQEILHDCVSVQPCLHSFCAGCFSEWMQGTCPSCRQPCTRVARNHLVKNIVEEYLKRYPERRRPKEDLDELDAKNKIKKDLVFRHGALLDSDSSPDMFIPSRQYIPRPVCRQCPSYVAQPGENTSVAAPAFVCDMFTTVHVLCQCCLRSMPKRNEPDIRAMQQCANCFAFFCGAYFGCNDSCRGCLRPMKDTSLSGLCEDAILNNNPYESRVLLDHLRERSVSLQQLLADCAENLVSHRLFTPQNVTAGVNADSHVCRACGQRMLREFAYHYRAALPRDQLHASVLSRPDCHWGRFCRTQIRMNHAEKYNHICEQTRHQ